MFVIRLYVAGLTLTFFFAVLATRGLGVLESIVVVCALLYLILDIRADLQDLRELEAQVLTLLG